MTKVTMAYGQADSTRKPLYVATQRAHTSGLTGWIPLVVTKADRYTSSCALVSDFPSLSTQRRRMNATKAPGERLWSLVRDVPGVEALWIDRDQEAGLDVRVIANNLSWDDERALFALYRRWVRLNPGIWAQLHVVDRQGVPIEELCSLDPDTVAYG